MFKINVTASNSRINMNTVKRTEKGWAGHLIVSNQCLFRRHTLLEYGTIAISVSTAGNWMPGIEGLREIMEIGAYRYFETMVFHSLPVTEENKWKDADVSKPINFSSPWYIREPWKEQEANDMHETVVNEITGRLLAGDQFIITEE